MKSYLVVTVLLAVVLAGCSSRTPEQSAIPPGVRTIEAVRADVPPVLDGILDDACWKKVKPVAGFVTLYSDRSAAYQSLGYVSYDDSHLYIGMKCLMAEGVKPKGKERPHDTYVFGDDGVEIMLDPGRTQSEYYQLVVTAYGSTYDSARKSAGAQNDSTWNGDWTVASYTGEGYWSTELSVPFHNLGISPEVGSTWGINFCRNAMVPQSEHSTIAADGSFNNARAFALLKGLNVDFSKYLFQIGPPTARLQSSGERPRALFSVPVRNMTGKTKKIKIDRWYSGSEDKDAVESKVIALKPNEAATFFAEPLEIEPLSPKRTDGYIIRSLPRTKKIVVSDAEEGTVLALSFVKRPWFCEAMQVEVEDPWQRDMSSKKSATVSLTVYTYLDGKSLKEGELVVELSSRETGKTLAQKRFSQPSETIEVIFPTKDLPWGAYDARATFKDSTGREIVSSSTLATVLPGGKQRIKVLNNLVSELMNAGERGLLNGKEVAFMNPREGWVFFSLSGPGQAILDSEEKALTGTRAGEVVEAMRYLPAGRHLLHIKGKLEQAIVRAIPQLVYSSNPRRYGPDAMKEAFLNANTILGGSREDPFMHEWVEAGKRWLTFAAAPSHGLVEGLRTVDTLVPPERYYEQLTSHPGFGYPLTNGVMVDQIGSSSPAQKMAIAITLARIADNPEFQNRVYCPWYEGGVPGSEANRAMLKVVLEAGWPFSFYRYLSEQPTEEQVRDQIQAQIVQTLLGFEAEFPGSLRRAVVTLGYMCHAPTGISQNVNANANFRVLMQRQMEALANDPALFGVFGALWYYSPYVDEENLRWAGRLFRHYGIEGKTAPLSTDPYVLAHIENPDFEQGTEGWTVSEAEPDTVGVKSLTGYGALQCRYLGGTKGDTFLVTRRSGKGPNKFSQSIVDLTPGRVYSLKMITADYRNILEGKSVKQEDAISINLENAEMVEGPEKNLQQTYSHRNNLGKFTAKNLAWMNFHWYVFRAKAKTARLTISDWATVNNPGGPTGQELMYNFIEVQPYLED